MTPKNGAVSIHDIALGTMLGWTDYGRRGDDPEFVRRTTRFDGRLFLAIDDAWAVLGFPVGERPSARALRIEGAGLAVLADPNQCLEWLRSHPRPMDAALAVAVGEARDMGEQTGLTCGFVGGTDGLATGMFLIGRSATMDIDRRPHAQVKLGYVVEPRLLTDAAEAEHPRCQVLLAAVLQRQVVHDLQAVFGRIGSDDTGVRLEVACAGDAAIPGCYDAALRAGVDEFIYRRMVGRLHCPRVQCKRPIVTAGAP
jgi:hypothetical protein